MTQPTVGICTVFLSLPSPASLKDKRAIIQSMLKRVHQTFNVSAAEVDKLDNWNEAVITFAAVSNSRQHMNSVITNVLNWIDEHCPDALVTNETIEIL